MFLDSFRKKIYEFAFPDPNEVEPFDKIEGRIFNPESALGTLVVLAIEDGEVYGGLIADWYSGCRSIEIIYIAVSKEFTRRGLGSRLLNEGTRLICDSLGGNIKCVYAEVENPFTAYVPTGSIDPVSRLKFFSTQGARRVPIDYIQPPLEKGKGYANNLFLICFPAFSKCGEDGIATKDLSAFLQSFYDGLEENASDDPEKFRETRDQLLQQVADASDYEDKVIFDHILEEPSFKIYNATVGSHYLIDVQEDSCELSRDRFQPCPYFNSYESDLLNYRHQTGHRPLYTHHAVLQENVRLLLPKCYEYSSEGLTYFRLCGRSVINVDISLNWTYNALSGKYMAHLSMSPVYGEQSDYFTELDFIRLVAGFGSRQERYRCMSDDGRIYTADRIWECFKIEIPGFEPIGLVDWMKKTLGIDVDFIYQGTGFSDINLAGLKDICGKNVFRDFDSFRSKILDPKGPDAAFQWNKVMCGIILGIFDFNRMMSSEIFDTIRPIVQRKISFAVLNRGHLHEISYSTDMLNNRDEDLLSSPYILIPSAALAFNESLLDGNVSLLDTLSKEETQFSFRRYKKSDNAFYSRSREIQRVLKKVKRSLNEEYLREIFQYISEKEILEVGSVERGLNFAMDTLEKRIEDFKDTRDSYLDEYKNGFEMNQNMILLVLAILQVVTAILSQSKWWIIVAVSMALVIVFYLYGRVHIRKNRKD